MTAQALEIRDLAKTYARGPRALDGVSLDVGDGEFFGLLGPNGAGKSTLIGIVSTLVRASSGSVRIYGHDLAHHRQQALAQLGLVPQELNFNQFETPLEIIVNHAGYYGVSRPTALARAEQLLHELKLWDKRAVPSRALSGGMKRRLMIARALAHQPRLLILDEPTAGVDIEMRRDLWAFIRTLHRSGTTVILTTHYLEEAEQLCERIAIIDHGRLIENQPTRVLLARLDVETFVLDLAEPMLEMATLEGLTLRQLDPLTLELELPRGAEVSAAFARLIAAGIRVRSLRNKANRLEELFLRLTQRPVVTAA